MEERIAEQFLLDEPMLRQAMRTIASCRYCEGVSQDPGDNAPVACTKFAGSVIPIGVNIAACLSCDEFHKLCGAAGCPAPSTASCKPPS